MEKSLDMDSDEWELLLPDFKPRSERCLLTAEDIDANYFSNDKISKPRRSERNEDTAIQHSQDEDQALEFEDIGVGKSPVEPERILFNQDEQEEGETFSKDEKSSEKKIEYTKPEIKIRGVGVLYFIGVAAASVCVFILGGHQLQKHHRQKIQFRIYAGEKRIKGVAHQATGMNHEISSAGGVSSTRAHISFGGCYDGI